MDIGNWKLEAHPAATATAGSIFVGRSRQQASKRRKNSRYGTVAFVFSRKDKKVSKQGLSPIQISNLICIKIS
jgi:hypothetical protein